MQQLLQILREFGFPILVCLWFMLRLEKKLEEVGEKINKLTVVNTVIARTLDVQDDQAQESVPQVVAPQRSARMKLPKPEPAKEPAPAPTDASPKRRQ